MGRTILCTAGTSIAQGCAALRLYQNRASAWDEDSAALAAEVRARVAALDFANPTDRVRASAELNALHRLQVSPTDEVVLFATDTADGRCCAEQVRHVLTSPAFALDPTRVLVERVPGLQVHDAERLRRAGLVELTRRMITYLDDPQRRHGGGCILCPNGGFKGVVPFMTLAGMIFRAPVVYVFEFSDALITLPPLPLGLATDLFERALPALRWGREQGAFEAEAFFRRVAGYAEHERELFNGFLELEPDSGRETLATLSPLADVLTQREGGEDCVLQVSATALAEIEALDGPIAKELQDHLRKLASPMWRSQHLDTKHRSDLDFFPRGHNPWRFAGFVTQGQFHLCWFTRQKAEYLRAIAQPERQRAAYPAQVFRPYVVEAAGMEPEAEGSDAGASWLDLRAERDALRAEVAALAQQLEAQRQGTAESLARERERHLAAERKLSAQLEGLHRRQWEAELRLDEDDGGSARPARQAGTAWTEAVDTAALVEAWRGRTVEARPSAQGELARSWLFEARDPALAGVGIVVPKKSVEWTAVPPNVSLEITGHDGRHLQARPIEGGA